MRRRRSAPTRKKRRKKIRIEPRPDTLATSFPRLFSPRHALFSSFAACLRGEIEVELIMSAHYLRWTRHEAQQARTSRRLTRKIIAEKLFAAVIQPRDEPSPKWSSSLHSLNLINETRRRRQSRNVGDERDTRARDEAAMRSKS